MAEKSPKSIDRSNRVIPHCRLEKEKIHQLYEFGKKLGQGSFGVVCEAVSLASGQMWAVKIINKEKAGSSGVKLLEREVSILKKVQHEHIIHLEEILETPEKMYLVIELADKGELADLHRSRTHLNEDEAKTVLRRLASAIVYLHKADIVHRDLKLENILLAENPKDKDDQLYLKVTDFGLSVVMGGVGQDNMMQTFCGTPMYMSPEIIDSKKTYSQQCDVWAMGVITYMIINGSPPFQAKDEEALYSAIKQGDLDFSSPAWVDISEEAKSCIHGMLKVNPAHRLTAKEVMDHSWITGAAAGHASQPTNVLEMMKQWKDELYDDTSSLASASTLSVARRLSLDAAEQPRRESGLLKIAEDAGSDEAAGSRHGNDKRSLSKTPSGLVHGLVMSRGSSANMARESVCERITSSLSIRSYGGAADGAPSKRSLPANAERPCMAEQGARGPAKQTETKMAAGRTNSRFLHPAGASVAAATRKSSSRVGTKPTKQTTSVSNTRAAAAAAAAGGGGMASAASVPAGIRGKSPSSSPLSKQAKPASLSTAAKKPSPQKTAAANTNNKNLPAATKKR